MSPLTIINDVINYYAVASRACRTLLLSDGNYVAPRLRNADPIDKFVDGVIRKLLATHEQDTSDNKNALSMLNLVWPSNSSNVALLDWSAAVISPLY